MLSIDNLLRILTLFIVLKQVETNYCLPEYLTSEISIVSEQGIL